MSFDRATLDRTIAANGPVIRVVLAEVRGSVPRGVGTAMLVWADGQSGTIGGGALEWEAVQRARRMLPGESDRQVWSLPLGPSLGQCCGGAVVLLAERYAETPAEDAFPLARPVTARGAMPTSVATAQPADARLIDGWLVEPLARPVHAVWIWGAGHVGTALAAVMAPLPDTAITWVDEPGRLPATAPEGFTLLPAPDMARAMTLAPRDAHHLVLTYSHDIDLALCHAALTHGFATCGLIGSDTKWARFRSRLRSLGHSDAQISGIDCPIGDPALGKHPQAIAVGVAARHLNRVNGRAEAPVRAGVG
ncbi:xanthine dehydrogenase accessory protein XdhC [Rhodobacterales bacterium HKCCE2091]|nr:xanthine dehydrogenase accessory protein XdhC [Rhodobacterales bacterium HKCCE2091]